MAVSWIVLLIVAGVVLVAGFAVVLVFSILFLLKSLGGTAGGWRRLAEVFGTASPPGGQILAGQTLMIGSVTYRRCVTVGIADEGLYLRIWRTTALIPWDELKLVGQATLYWQKVPMLTAGNPPVATITVPAAVFQRLPQKPSLSN